MTDWFAVLVQAADPEGRIRTMSDAQMVEALEDFAEITAPNRFHAEIFALLHLEVLKRWKKIAGIS
jgi:hypothetical protein